MKLFARPNHLTEHICRAQEEVRYQRCLQIKTFRNQHQSQCQRTRYSWGDCSQEVDSMVQVQAYRSNACRNTRNLRRRLHHATVTTPNLQKIASWVRLELVRTTANLLIEAGDALYNEYGQKKNDTNNDNQLFIRKESGHLHSSGKYNCGSDLLDDVKRLK